MRPDPKVQIGFGIGAALLAVALVALFAFVPDPFFRQRVYVTTFDDVAAVTAGAPVYFRGAAVGQVRKVDLDTDRSLFNVRLGVRRDWRPPPCAFARIQETNPLVAPRIELVVPASPGACPAQRLAAGCQTLSPPARAANPLDGCRRAPDLMELAAAAVAQANATLGKIDAMVSGTGGGAAGGPDPKAMMADLATTAASLEAITGRLNQSLTQARLNDVGATLTNVRVVTGQAAQIDMAKINAAIANANATLAQVQGLLEANKAGVGTAVSQAGGLAADSRDLVGAMAAPMASAAENLDRASQNIEAASEAVKNDPTSLVRRRGYKDPPPPGAAP